MRQLLRSAEGAISRAEFRKGAGFVLALCLAVAALYCAIAWLNRTMDWMTVAVAPFAGVIMFAAYSSIIYFWYCLFAKRLRGMGRRTMLANAWLGAILVWAASALVHYQNRTLELAVSGWIAQAGNLAMAACLLAVGLFLVLLAMGWFGPDRTSDTER